MANVSNKVVQSDHPKKIVLFSDGTGNSSASAAKTNVWRTYKALDVSPGSHQLAFYDGGVGTNAFSPLKFIGLIFGWGLAKNVKQIYKFACLSYTDRPDINNRDEIYGFGFSRGAFTMRVVMGLIAHQGIIDTKGLSDRELDRSIIAAYREFRRTAFDASFLSSIGRPIQSIFVSLVNKFQGREPYNSKNNFEYSSTPEVENNGTRQHLIKFVGVWDTVDAYGLPIDEMTRAWDTVIWPLSAKDRDLSPRIAQASHALALDEQRESFEPMLWNETNDNGEDTRITQVWFAGVHANIGGGYHDDSLANVSLNWMLEQSEKNSGLKFIPGERLRLKNAANINGPKNDNRTGAGNMYRYSPRHIAQLCNSEIRGLLTKITGIFGKNPSNKNKVEIKTPKIHRSVFDRIQLGVENYSPINIPDDYFIIEYTGKQSKIGGTYGKRFIESKTQVSNRIKVQNIVWDDVLKAKHWYVFMLLVIGLFGFFPWINGEISGLIPFVNNVVQFVEPVLGPISGIIRSIPTLIGKIPLPFMDYVGIWADKFEAYPYVFLIFIIVIFAILARSKTIRTEINDNMTRGWSHITSIKLPAQKLVHKFGANSVVKSDVYANNSKFGRYTRNFIEILSFILFLGISVSIFSQAVFIVQDGFGATCSDTKDGLVELTSSTLITELNLKDSLPKSSNATVKFDGKNPCYATGYKLNKDQRYHIRWEVKSDWKDAGKVADVNGLVDGTPFKMYFATLIRRHIFSHWYQPMTRIDNNLFDIYPLEHTSAILPEWVTSDMLKAEPLEETIVSSTETGNNQKIASTDTKFRCKQIIVENKPRRVLCTIIKPKRSGELFLFVNDAILFTPNFPHNFYSNNQGYATVSIVALSSNDADVN